MSCVLVRAAFVGFTLCLAACTPSSVGSCRGSIAPGMCPGSYPDWATSPYNLPWAVGSSFKVGQGSCTTPTDSHAAGTTDAFAVDIDMPIGTHILAARAGTVTAIKGQYQDGTKQKANFVKIQHDDGTVAEYYHLTQNGPRVSVGDRVTQGQLVALSGNTGDSSQPHLHFQVEACAGQGSIPVTFKNTAPNPSGLIEGQTYTAQ